jgi:hypothetical protein
VLSVVVAKQGNMSKGATKGSAPGPGKKRLPRIYFAAPAYRVTGEPAKEGYVGSYFTTQDLKQFVQNFNAKKHSYYSATDRDKLTKPRVFELGYLHPDLEGKKDRIGEQRDLLVDDRLRLVTICRLNPLTEGGKLITEMLMNDPNAKVGVSLDYETEKIEHSDDPDFVKYRKYLKGISIVPQPAYKFGYIQHWAATERELLRKLFAPGTAIMGGSEDDDLAADTAADAKGMVSSASKANGVKAARPIFVGKNLRARVLKATGQLPLANVMQASATSKANPESAWIDAESADEGEEKKEAEEEEDQEDENEKFGEEDDEEEEEGEPDEIEGDVRKALAGGALPEPADDDDDEDAMEVDDSTVFVKNAESTSRSATPQNAGKKPPLSSPASKARQSSAPPVSSPPSPLERKKQPPPAMADQEKAGGKDIKKYPTPTRAETAKGSVKRPAASPVNRASAGAAAAKTQRSAEGKNVSPATSRPGEGALKKKPALQQQQPAKRRREEPEEDAMDLDEEPTHVKTKRSQAKPEPEDDEIEREEQEEEQDLEDVDEGEQEAEERPAKPVVARRRRPKQEEEMLVDEEEEEEAPADEDEEDVNEDPYAIDREDVQQMLDDKNAAEEELQEMLDIDTEEKKQAFFNQALREKAQLFMQKNKMAGDAVEIMLEKVGAPEDTRDTLRDIQARMMAGRDVSKYERQEYAQAMAAAAGRVGSAEAAHPALVEKKLRATERQKQAAVDGLRSTAPLTGGTGLVRKKAAAAKAGVGGFALSLDGGRTHSAPMSWASSAFDQTFSSHDPIRRTAPIDPFGQSFGGGGGGAAQRQTAPRSHEAPVPMHIPTPRLTGGRGGGEFSSGGIKKATPKPEPSERERAIAWHAQRFDPARGRRLNADDVFGAALASDAQYAKYNQPLAQGRGWFEEMGFSHMGEKLKDLTKRYEAKPWWQEVVERVVYPTEEVGKNPTYHEVYKMGFSTTNEGDPQSYTGAVPRLIHSSEPLIIGEEGDVDAMRDSAAFRMVKAF